MKTALTILIVIALSLLMACAGPKGRGGQSDGGLFRGDRVNINREFIYLDDPLFLQTKSVYGYRSGAGPAGPVYFSFQVPIYFNAGPKDTLRFGPGGIAVRTGGAMVPGDSSAPAEPVTCLIDTGEVRTDPADLVERFREADRVLILAPRREGSSKVNLVFHCRNYDPPWGRMDTLSLAFHKKTGAEDFKEVAFSLPYHVSYHSPVVSVLLGLGLLYAFTQAGVWIAGM